MNSANKKRILIYGWFGENNYGDELLLRTMIEMIENKSELFEVSVMGSKPDKIINNHPGLKCVSSSVYYSTKRIIKIIITNPVEVCKNLCCNDILIVSGGGAISDWNKDSTREMFFLINHFSRHNKKVYLMGMGAGPITKEGSGERFNRILSKVEVITTRDKYSYNELKKIGLSNIRHSNDLAYYSSVHKQLKSPSGNIRNIGLVLAPVCLNSPDVYKKFISEIKKLLILLKYNYQVSLIPFQYEYDKNMLDSIVEGMDEISILYEETDIWSVEKFIGDQDLIIGMRYHSMILSVLLGKYLIPIIYHPKNASFCDEFKMRVYAESIGNGENWINSNISADSIISNIEKLKRDELYTKKCEDIINKKRLNSIESEILMNIAESNNNG